MAESEPDKNKKSPKPTGNKAKSAAKVPAASRPTEPIDRHPQVTNPALPITEKAEKDHEWEHDAEEKWISDREPAKPVAAHQAAIGPVFRDMVRKGIDPTKGSKAKPNQGKS